MAGNSNIFALLLAGLDVNASAEEINKQLNSAQFKDSLDGLKTTLKLDENTFKALETAMKDANRDAESLKKTLTEASVVFAKLQADRQNTGMQKASSDMLMEHAKTQLPGIDFTTIKKDIDPLTNMVKSLTLEWNKTGDAVYRVKVRTDDLSESGFSMDSIRMVETVRKEFQSYELDVARTVKELERLTKQEAERGKSAELTAQIEQANLKLVGSYDKIVNVLQSAKSSANLTNKEFVDLERAAGEVFTAAETQGKTFAQSLENTEAFNKAKASLSEYKREYAELGELANKQQVEGNRFSQVDQERLSYLQKNTAELQNTLEAYPPLLAEAKKLREAQKPLTDQNLAKQEATESKKIIAELAAEYTKLAKTKHDMNMRGLKVGTEQETAALASQKQVIEENIRVIRDRLSTVQTTAAGQEAATRGLQDLEAANVQRAELDAGKFADAQKKKEDAIRKFAGTATGLFAELDFSKLGESLDTADPKFQALAEKLYGAKAAVKELKRENDGLGNSYLTLSVVQDKTADTLQYTKVRVNELTGAMTTLDAGTAKNVSRMMGFTEQLGHAVKKMAVWGVAAKLLHGSLQQFKKGFEFVKELDKDITQAAIVTGKQRSEVQGLSNDYAQLALDMGKTVGEISKVNTALLRQGLTIEESGRRLDTITKLSAAGQISTENSLHIVTAAVNAMQESHVTASDVMLKASNISASSVEELGEAFTKTASSAYATGMSIQQTTGILATMLEVTQEGPSQLGTSLKTILARFTRVNEETGEFNEELNKVQTAVQSVGVSFLKSDGQIRNVYDILKDLSGVWQDLDKNQQAYIATTAAGVRMQNRFFALMNNFERVQTITEQTGLAAGATEKAFTVYLDSVEAASNRTKASLEQLWINIINPEDVKMMYNFATGVIKAIDAIGGLNVATTAVVAVFLAKTGALSKMTGGIAKYIATQKVMAMSTGVTSMSFEAMNATIAATAAGLGVTVTAMLATIAVVALLGIAIVAVARHFQKQKAAAAENAKALDELNLKYQDQAQNAEYDRKELEALGNEYQELTDKIKASGLSADRALNTEEFMRFTEVQEKMLSIYPELATETDKYGNKLIILSDGVKGIIAQYDEFVDVTAENFKAKHTEMIDTVIGDLKEYQAAIQRAKMIQAEPVLGGSNISGQGTIRNEAELAVQQALYDEILRKAEEQTAAYAVKVQQATNIFIAANESSLNAYQIKMLSTQAVIDNAVSQGLSGTELVSYLNGLTEVATKFASIGPLIEDSVSEIDALNAQFDAGTIGISAYMRTMDELIAKHKELLGEKIAALELDIARREGAGMGADKGQLETLQALRETYGYVNDAKREQIELEQHATTMWNSQAKALEDAQTGMGKITGILDKMKDGYHKTADGIKAINGVSPDLLEFLHDENLLRQKLTERLAEQEQTHLETYMAMMETSESFYQQSIILDTDFINAMEDNNITDYQNFKNLAQAKLEVEAKLVTELSRLWGQFYQQTAEGLTTLQGAGGLIDSEFGLGLHSSGIKDKIDEINKKRGIFNDLALKFSKAGYKDLSASLSGGSDKKSSKGGGKEKETKKTNDLLKQQQEEYKILSDLLDAQIRKIQISNDSLEEGLEGLRKQIADVDTSTMEGLQEKYRLTEQLIQQENLYLDSLKEEQRLAHEKANTLRAMAPHLDTTKWFDANNESTEEYVLQLAKADESTKNTMTFLFSNLQKLKNLWTGNADEVKKNIELQKDLGKEMEKLVAKQKEMNDELREKARVKWIADQNDLYQKQQDRLSSLAAIQEVIVGIIRKRGEEEKKVLDDAHQAEMSSLDERHKERIKAYQDDLDQFKKTLQGKIDALDASNEAEDYSRSLTEQQAKITELEKRHNVLLGDDSLDSRNKRAAIEKELISERQKMSDMERDRNRKLTKDEYQNAIKSKEDHVNGLIEAENKTFENQKDNYDRDYQMHKTYLDDKYTNDKIYAEAKEAIEKDAVEVTKGRIVSVQEAYEEFENVFGKGMGFLGDSIKNDFLSKLKEAQQAIKDLEYTAQKWLPKYGSDYQPTDAQTGFVESQISGIDNTDSYKQTDIYKKYGDTFGKLSEQLLSQLFMNSMAAFDQQGGYEHLELMEFANRMANFKRGKGFTVSSTEALLKRGWKAPAYEHGGKVTGTGMAVSQWHGTQSDPEWIFNDSQLKKIMQKVSESALKTMIPNLPSLNRGASGNAYSIVFDVKGNLDRSILPEVKNMITAAIEKTEFEKIKSLNKVGQFRPV